MYDAAIEAKVSKEKAVVLCNIFRNMHYMGCEYPEEVMRESQKYWPEDLLDKKKK